jgi:hypothetical protein
MIWLFSLLVGGFLLCFLLVGVTSNTISYWSGRSGGVAGPQEDGNDPAIGGRIPALFPIGLRNFFYHLLLVRMNPVLWRGLKKTAIIRLWVGGFLFCFLLVGGTSIGQDDPVAWHGLQRQQ